MVLNKGMSISDFVLYIGLVASFSTAMTDMFCNMVWMNMKMCIRDSVIIVGHGAMDSSIVCQVQNIPLEKFWDAGIENCKLMKLL